MFNGSSGVAGKVVGASYYNGGDATNSKGGSKDSGEKRGNDSGSSKRNCRRRDKW